MKNLILFSASVVMAACLSLSPSAFAAQSTAWLSVGTMDCTIGTSLGAAVGARQHARCEFKSERQGESSMYFGRLERSGRSAGLPAGAKLMWMIYTPASDTKTMSGRYRLSPGDPKFEGRDAYTLCQPRPNAICLRPLPADVHWKPNLAATVSVISFESNPVSRRKEVRR